MSCFQLKGDINKERVFALVAKYVLHMPDKDQLIAQVEDVISKWEK